MKPSAPSWSRRRAFTLIELLVVVAIIMLLMALLFPALEKVQQVAWKVKCVHNLRSASASCFLYAQDYQGWFPNGCRAAFCIWSGCGPTCYVTNSIPNNGNHTPDGCCDDVTSFNVQTFGILTNRYGLMYENFYCAARYGWNGGTIPAGANVYGSAAWYQTHHGCCYDANTDDLVTGIQYYARRCGAECTTYWSSYAGDGTVGGGVPLWRNLRKIGDTDPTAASSPVLMTCGVSTWGGWQWYHSPAAGGVALYDGRVIWTKQSDWCGNGVCW